MINLTKNYHFYAAHRNKMAGEKCGRIHGHCYEMTIHLSFGEFNDITILFSDVDMVMNDIIKKYDHYFLLYEKDELCQILDSCGEPYVKLPFETSAENMAVHFYNLIKPVLPISKIELKETKSSNIIYEGNN